MLFISLCYFRYFLITHYRPPFASTLLLYLIAAIAREGRNFCASRGALSIYLLGYRASIADAASEIRGAQFAHGIKHAKERLLCPLARVYHEILKRANHIR